MILRSGDINAKERENILMRGKRGKKGVYDSKKPSAVVILDAVPNFFTASLNM